MAEVKFMIEGPSQWGYGDAVYESGVEHTVDADRGLREALVAAEAAGVLVTLDGDLSDVDVVESDEDSLALKERIDAIRAELIGERDSRINARVSAELADIEDSDERATVLVAIHDEENASYEASVDAEVERGLG